MQEQVISKREAISQIKSLFRGINSDATLTNKLVWSLLKKHSIWIIKRDSERFKLLKKQNLFQIKKCINVIKAPATDSCCGLRMKNCDIYRTEDKLPEMYEDLAGVIIKNVTSIDKHSEVRIYSPAEYRRLTKNPFASTREIRGFFSDGYLYFIDKHYEKIDVEAMFIDELDEDNQCDPCEECDNNCIMFLDKRWIIPDYLQAQTIDFVIKELSETFFRVPEKSENINKNDNK